MALNKSIIKNIVILFIAIVFTITMAILLLKNNNIKLTLIDDKTNKILGTYTFKNEQTFSISFIHSVNNSKITDYYEIIDNQIINTKTIYYNFGAGVQTELNDTEVLEYGNNGEMIINKINKHIKPLLYIVGTVSHHILNINNKNIILDDLYGKNRHIRFEITGG